MEYEQYCSYCGLELEVRQKRISLGSNERHKLLVCPKLSIWSRKHTSRIIGVVDPDTILNYDPFTGERITK